MNNSLLWCSSSFMVASIDFNIVTSKCIDFASIPEKTFQFSLTKEPEKPNNQYFSKVSILASGFNICNEQYPTFSFDRFASIAVLFDC